MTRSGAMPRSGLTLSGVMHVIFRAADERMPNVRPALPGRRGAGVSSSVGLAQPRADPGDVRGFQASPWLPAGARPVGRGPCRCRGRRSRPLERLDVDVYPGADGSVDASHGPVGGWVEL